MKITCSCHFLESIELKHRAMSHARHNKLLQDISHLGNKLSFQTKRGLQITQHYATLLLPLLANLLAVFFKAGLTISREVVQHCSQSCMEFPVSLKQHPGPKYTEQHQLVI